MNTLDHKWIVIVANADTNAIRALPEVFSERCNAAAAAINLADNAISDDEVAMVARLETL